MLWIIWLVQKMFVTILEKAWYLHSSVKSSTFSELFLFCVEVTCHVVLRFLKKRQVRICSLKICNFNRPFGIRNVMRINVIEQVSKAFFFTFFNWIYFRKINLLFFFRWILKSLILSFLRIIFFSPFLPYTARLTCKLLLQTFFNLIVRRYI